ncbi:MAG: nucleoside transporter C-terminal domain-containing protein [Myxococcota bacterium]|nr:nucleoside transporter C-terminal domain-containing protein [Myxococcota bacterium]
MDSGTPIGLRLLSLLGIAVFVGLGWLISVDRRSIRWKPVLWGVGLQFIFGVIVLHPTMQDVFFGAVNGGVTRLLSFAEAGATFIFGAMEAHEVTEVNLVTGEKSPTLFLGTVSPSFKNIAFWIILPTIIFFSSLMSILYQVGVMQRVVWGIAWVMQRTMGTTGPESLSAAANIFVGQTEAPLVIKPYIDRMSSSELHAVMTGGFATVAGGVMAAYVGFLQGSIPTIAGHLVAASIMSAPAALAISKVVFPMDRNSQQQDETMDLSVEKPYGNIIEAAAEGAAEGMKLALNVLAMLVAFVGLIALINWGLGLVSIGGSSLSLELILGWVFAPLAFVMGVPWEEALQVGSLLGKKLVMTEFVAYLDLAQIMGGPNPLSERSAIIASYALCGFANFASIGIQIGGIGGIAPERTTELSAMGLRAMMAGTLAAFMTATIAGCLLG